MARSPQTLDISDRRKLALWAAACAERVPYLFEADRPGDHRPHTAISRTRAFGRGELGAASEIRRRFGGGSAASEVQSPAASAAARAAGQASAVCHMGAHALGAAAYAANAASLASPDQPDAARDEIVWQLAQMTLDVKAALQSLPPVGHCRSGPLGPGLLASGQIGQIIRNLQAEIAR